MPRFKLTITKIEDVERKTRNHQVVGYEPYADADINKIFGDGRELVHKVAQLDPAKLTDGAGEVIRELMRKPVHDYVDATKVERVETQLFNIEGSSLDVGKLLEVIPLAMGFGE